MKIKVGFINSAAAEVARIPIYKLHAVAVGTIASTEFRADLKFD
jgi:hypothetical protein